MRRRRGGGVVFMSGSGKALSGVVMTFIVSATELWSCRISQFGDLLRNTDSRTCCTGC